MSHICFVGNFAGQKERGSVNKQTIKIRSIFWLSKSIRRDRYGVFAVKMYLKFKQRLRR